YRQVPWRNEPACRSFGAAVLLAAHTHTPELQAADTCLPLAPYSGPPASAALKTRGANSPPGICVMEYYTGYNIRPLCAFWTKKLETSRGYISSRVARTNKLRH
ncbi:unnamed protein product, partial [Ectocarpus fasciculatus]